jgi:hypothetical protein
MRRTVELRQVQKPADEMFLAIKFTWHRQLVNVHTAKRPGIWLQDEDYVLAATLGILEHELECGLVGRGEFAHVAGQT